LAGIMFETTYSEKEHG